MLDYMNVIFNIKISWIEEKREQGWNRKERREREKMSELCMSIIIIQHASDYYMLFLVN